MAIKLTIEWTGWRKWASKKVLMSRIVRLMAMVDERNNIIKELEFKISLDNSKSKQIRALTEEIVNLRKREIAYREENERLTVKLSRYDYPDTTGGMGGDIESSLRNP